MINEEIIEKTVKKTLTAIGFDMKDPIEIQKDMAHLRNLRQGKKISYGIIRQVLITSGIIAFIEWIKTHT